WKIPICYDDDEDYTIAITPVLSTEEPVIIEDEHLDAIPATESDEVIKSSVENLVPTSSESEGIPDKMCDVPLCDNPTPLEAFKDHSEIVVDSNDDSSSSDDDSFSSKDIEYVDASPPDAEIVSLEVVEMISFSSSISLNLFLEETNTFDNSIPESETFCFNLEEISSEAFYDHIKEKSSGSTTTHADFSQYDPFVFDLSINPFPPADRSDCYHEEFAGELAHIISLPKNKIFDPGIFIGVQSMIFLSSDEFSFSFIRDPPLPVIDTLLPFSSENENKVVNTGILALEEKSYPSSSHRGFKASKLSLHKSPMLIHGDNTPNLGVRQSYFYPP
ncbi:hypothetical protein Tco_1443668, partial [Tanacetum coccineum]